MNTKNHPYAPAPSWALFTVFASLALLTACDKRAEARPKPAETKEGASAHEHVGATLYQCPMHPQIIRKGPGSCPICGMTLVPVHLEDSTRDTMSSTPAAAESSPVVKVDAVTARNVGLRTRRVERVALARALRLDGKVAVDETRLRSVTARVGGFAEVVRARAEGQSVRRGEAMAELYSPEVAAAQARLLQSGGGAAYDAQETRERLANWGVPASFVARVERAGRAERRFPVPAPVDGVVLLREVIEGQAVSPGMELFRVADLSTVWVTARVYASDLAWVRVGARATLRFPNLPGETVASRVFFVAPAADAATRTVEIRMSARNTPALDLKPELLAEVTLEEEAASPVLAVPSQALIRSGARTLAVVALGGGRYQPREVTAGRESEGRVEIMRGLSEGDEVVESAQFLIDAESNLRAAVERLRAEGGDHDR